MAPRKRVKRGDAEAIVEASNAECKEDDQQQETRRKSARVRQVRAAAPAPAPVTTTNSSSSRNLSRTLEQSLANKGTSIVIGVDEAGRGPLAGPVVAAACYVPLDVEIEGIYDSKAVKEEDRERIYEELTSNPRVLYAWARVEPEEIEEVNILQASMLAMKRSVTDLVSRHNLKSDECYALADGPYLPDLPVDGKPVVKGDSKVFSIAAASIIAKVVRDRIMVEYENEYPGYGLAKHKGYPTAAHMAAVASLGPSRIHRLTFRPIPDLFPDAMMTFRGKPYDTGSDDNDTTKPVKAASRSTTKGSRAKKQPAKAPKKAPAAAAKRSSSRKSK